MAVMHNFKRAVHNYININYNIILLSTDRLKPRNRFPVLKSIYPLNIVLSKLKSTGMNSPKLTALSAACLLLVFLSSCKKDPSSPSPVAEAPPGIESASVQANANSNCRLTLVEWPFGSYGFQYNSNGQCSHIQIPGMGYYLQQYNNAGRLTQSKYYSDGMLEATIMFHYNNSGSIIKETRYAGNTVDKTDEIFITRNNQGLITRMESFMNDYYLTAQYSPNGNNTAWQLYVSGELGYDVQYEYRHPYKNHYKSVKGVDYAFPFVNAFMFQSKFIPAAEKFTIYDEFGNAYVLHDYDPDNCSMIAGSQNYVSSSDWFDRISQGWTMYNYYYENCGPASSFTSGSSGPSSQSARNARSTPLKNLLISNPTVSLRQRFNTARKALLKEMKNHQE